MHAKRNTIKRQISPLTKTRNYFLTIRYNVAVTHCTLRRIIRKLTFHNENKRYEKTCALLYFKKMFVLKTRYDYTRKHTSHICIPHVIRNVHFIYYQTNVKLIKVKNTSSINKNQLETALYISLDTE